MIFKIGQAELYKRKKRFLNTTKYIIWFNGEPLQASSSETQQDGIWSSGVYNTFKRHIGWSQLDTCTVAQVYNSFHSQRNHGKAEQIVARDGYQRIELLLIHTERSRCSFTPKSTGDKQHKMVATRSHGWPITSFKGTQIARLWDFEDEQPWAKLAEMRLCWNIDLFSFQISFSGAQMLWRFGNVTFKERFVAFL